MTVSPLPVRTGLTCGIDIGGKGGERVFDERDVVALLRENIGNGLPARLVHKGPVHQHDVVGRSLRRFGGNGRAHQCGPGEQRGDG